jgi:hypothetical protein
VVVFIKIIVSWDVMFCSLVEVTTCCSISGDYNAVAHYCENLQIHTVLSLAQFKGESQTFERYVRGEAEEPRNPSNGFVVASTKEAFSGI